MERTFSTIVLGGVTFVLICLMAKELHEQRKARKVMTRNTMGQGADTDKERQITSMLFIIAIIFLVTKILHMIGQYTRTYGFRKN